MSRKSTVEVLHFSSVFSKSNNYAAFRQEEGKNCRLCTMGHERVNRVIERTEAWFLK